MPHLVAGAKNVKLSWRSKTLWNAKDIYNDADDVRHTNREDIPEEYAEFGAIQAEMPHEMSQRNERKTPETHERAHAEQKGLRRREHLQERHNECQDAERDDGHEVAKKRCLHAEERVI